MHQRFVEISVAGELDPASTADFDHVTVTADGDVTRLRLRVRDDSVLYGLLDRLQSTGLKILEVVRRDGFGDELGDEMRADPGS